MAPVVPGRVEPGPAADQQRQGDGEQHDADAADQDPDGVVQQLAAARAERASERDDAIAWPDPCGCDALRLPSVPKLTRSRMIGQIRKALNLTSVALPAATVRRGQEQGGSGGLISFPSGYGPAMQYRQLGSSGLVVSVVGLGANNFGRRIDLDGTRAVVDAAIEAGITLVDTADIYGNQGGSERLLGEVLKGRRDEVVLATKFGMDMNGANGPDWGARGSRRYIRLAVEASLVRLQTDWIDLYQYHAPDGVTPLEETLAALDELVREGKVRYIGSSNLAAWQVADSDSYAAPLRDEPVHQRAERLLVARSHGGAGTDARVRRARRGDPAVLPAGERPAHRQVPPGRAGTRPARAWRIAWMPSGTARSIGSRRSRPSPANARSRCSTSRSAGSRRNPQWAR